MRKLLFFTAAAAMMASCSKDMTEDVTTTPVVGKSTILATYNGNEGTRSVADWNEDDKKFVFTWESGDALGVFDAVAGDNTNAYFGYSAATDNEAANFTGSKDLLFAKNYVAYYPYDKNNQGIDKDGNLTLTIPATQSYRAHDVLGSFAQNLAPAVSYGVATEDDYIDMKFLSLASYVRVPIVGSGTITSLELTVDGAGLAGDFTVALSEVAEATKSADIKVTPAEDGFKGSIKLVCGKQVDDVAKGVELKDTPTYFWFVIPGGVDFKGKTVTIKINESEDLTRAYGADEAGVLAVNKSLAIGKAKAEDGSQVPFEWIEGAKDAVKISTAEQFVKYAYLATCGKVDKDGNALTAEVEAYAADFYDENGKLCNAIFMKDIDMAELRISNEHSDYVGGNGKEAKYNAFEEVVYYWWYHSKNNDAISTIGNYETAYSIDGRGFSLKGLNVKGNGLFCDGYDNSSNHAEATVKNLVLDNVTVNAGEGTNVFGERKTAWFLTNRHYNGGKTKYGITLTNVTVNENCVLEAEEGVNKVLTGRTFTDDLNEDDKYVVNNTELTYADQLCVMEDVTLADYENLYNYAAIHTTNGKSKIVTVADEAEARALIHDAVYVNGNKITTSEPKVWYSVMDVKGTSYWTGKTADAERKDDFFTAEELAFFVKNGNDVKLTNNIDLGYGGNRGAKDLPVTGFANSKEDVAWVTSEKAIKVDGAGKTISRATVTTGLFGAEATVDNLKVSGVFVNGAYLLAKTGTATKVTASGLNYSGAKAESGVLAGLFYEADIETAGDTADCTVTLNPDATVAEHEFFGYIYGVIGVDLGQVYELKAAGDAYGVFNCYVNDAEDDKHDSHTGITRIVFSNYTTRDELPRAKELVKWDTSKGEISDKHTVYFLTPAEANLPEAKLDTDNYLIYDGAMYDLDSAKAAAESGNVAFGNDFEEKNAEGTIITQGAAGVIDGMGHTLENTADWMGSTSKTWAVKAVGGTIKNLTVVGPGRHLGSNNKLTEDLTIEKCDLGQGGAYWANITGTNADAKVTFKECILTGWGSVTYALSFSKCEFKSGDYWNEENITDKEADPAVWNYAISLYGDVTFTDCNFEKDMTLNIIPKNATYNITLVNCKVDGVAVNKDNAATAFKVNAAEGSNVVFK